MEKLEAGWERFCKSVNPTGKIEFSPRRQMIMLAFAVLGLGFLIAADIAGRHGAFLVVTWCLVGAIIMAAGAGLAAVFKNKSLD